MSRRWRALACRIGEHGDVLLEVTGKVAELRCSRCGRRRLVRSLAPPAPGLGEQAAAFGVALVERDALDLLRAANAVNSALAGELARRLGRGDGL